jgi:midasin
LPQKEKQPNADEQNLFEFVQDDQAADAATLAAADAMQLEQQEQGPAPMEHDDDEAPMDFCDQEENEPEQTEGDTTANKPKESASGKVANKFAQMQVDDAAENEQDADGDEPDANDMDVEQASPVQKLNDIHSAQYAFALFLSDFRSDHNHQAQILDVAGNQEQVVDADKLRAEMEAEIVEWRSSPTAQQDAEIARRLWSQYDRLTHDLSLELCEQLRLILEPTLATKLKGDYRTGKRLNMKKMVSYIASQYKKDKIWMRRTKPSKRQYQVLIAVDDSKSMAESKSVQLAYEALALIAKALTQLEVGELSFMSFGESVQLLHPFDKPFVGDAGPELIRRLSFSQQRTHLDQLLDASGQFLDKQRSMHHGAEELWQLQIILSDGLCEDHEALRRRVRLAAEKRVMIVFVMIDQRDESESVLATRNVRFVNGQLVIQDYMDTFPFDYFVVLRNIAGLPETLSNALRQWFEMLAS